ncbi:TniQ family protein [Burkholderia cepacia]|uniref:TniQ family protein n=1 Tax=Burkholderia cepacia TaxID=292 RepID=UPI000F5DAFFA|nr:TniQ family protein [Burkholderia cepacia]
MMTSNTSSLPLCRPKILPDEWIETYLFRVARANGIRRPRLSDLERFRPTLPVTAGSKPDGYPIWSDTTLPRWSVVTRVNKIRYCPECMVQSRHIRSRWRLNAFEVCTLHHVRLKDDLAEPVMTRGYKQDDKYLITDVTDEQLWDGAVCPMPSERRHVDRLWSGFEQLILDGDLSGAFEGLTHILFLQALLDALAIATPESESLPIDAPRSTRLADLVEKNQFSLVSDSDGIRGFLDQITDSSHRNTVLARLRRMLLDEAHRPTCLSSLPIADLRRRFLMSGQKSTAPQTQGELHPGHGVPDGYVSFEKATALVECSRGHIRHFIRENIIQGSVTVHHGSKRLVFLPPQAVEACRRWYESVATREQVMKELHINRHGCLTLMNSGLPQPLTVSGQTYFYRKHLAGLCRRLEDLSQPCPAVPVYLQPLFGTWLQWQGPYTSNSREVLKEVLSGEFPIFRRLENPGLSAYFIDWTAIERLHQSKTDVGANRAQLKRSSQQLSLLPE